MNRDSAGAKIAVIVGIGAVAIGLAALRARVAAPAPRPDHVTTTSAVTPVPTADRAAEPKPASASDDDKPRPRGPTQADRIALLEACNEGDQARVEALFARGVNLDGTLGNAAHSGNAALVGWLVAHGVSPKEDDDLAVPPLLVADEHAAVIDVLLAKGAREPTLAKAVAAAAPTAVSRLLAKGASATSKSTEGEPVLLIALRDAGGAKRRAIVDALLKAGADPNVKYDGDTALGVAVAGATSRASAMAADDEARPGDRVIDVVGKLVAKDAKVDGDSLIAAMIADEDHRGPLLDALLAGTMERSATLLAVSHAAERHDVASIKRIAAKGVAWSAGEARATPPLATAIVMSDVPVVKALLDAGAPIDKMGEDADTGLLTAVAAAAGDSDEAMRVVRVLLERGASPNKRGRDGRTALYAAAQQGSEALVTLLVAKGARVDDAVDGMTPREVADAHGNDGVVKLLEARGAKRKKKLADD